MLYKPDQGRLVRMAAFWVLWLLFLYGCRSFRHEMDTWRFLPAAVKTRLVSVPLLGDVTVNVLISMVVLPAIAAFVLLRYLHRPKVSNFLIETEVELRKVAWPGMIETRGAAIIVITSVLVLMAFLAGADYVLGRLFDSLWAMGTTR